MINDTDKFSKKIRWLEEFCSFDGKSKNRLFWFFSIVFVPILAYLYSLPMSFLLGLMAEIFGLNEYNLESLVAVGYIICVVFAALTYYQLWKEFKKRNSIKETHNKSLE